MRSRRSVHLLSVEIGPEGGALDVSRIDVLPEGEGASCGLVDVPVFRAGLSPAEGREREALVRDLKERERRSLGDDVLLGDRGRDARTARLESARRAVDSWDHEHLFAPILSALATPAIVLHHGSEIPRFDLRAAQRQAIRAGRLAPSNLSDVVCLPIWPGDATRLEQLLAEVALDGLPVVDAAATTFLLGPPPPDPFLNTIAGMSEEDRAAALLSMPSEVTALAWRAFARADFIASARAAGVRVVPEATAEDLVASAPEPGCTLFVLAHQDEAGVHMHDRPVPLFEVGAGLSGRSGRVPYASVDLSVCQAQRPSNLSTLFQSFGATVVLSRGEVGYDGGMFDRFVRLLALLGEGERLSLPELHDLAWRRGAKEESPAP